MSTWVIPVPLLPDESLSSWLTRAALTQGCDPLVLTGAIWPGWRVWTLDIDRGIPNERLNAMSEASGVAVSDFQNAALYKDIGQIAGYPLQGSVEWPWLLALGSRNRSRHGGQQFCPTCLAQDPKPYFRRCWRFAWHTGCEKHEVQLIDHCPACGAPVEPHYLLAEDGHLACCPRCKTDLRNTVPEPVSTETLAFQRIADETKNIGMGTTGDKQVTVPDWFAMAHFFVSLIRQASRQVGSKLAGTIQSLGVNVCEDMLPVTGLPLELLPVAERQNLLAATYSLVSINRSKIIKAFLNAGITASTIHDARRPLPAPAKEMIARLENGQRGPRKPPVHSQHLPRSKRAVMAAWARLQRKMLTERK